MYVASLVKHSSLTLSGITRQACSSLHLIHSSPSLPPLPPLNPPHDHQVSAFFMMLMTNRCRNAGMSACEMYLIGKPSLNK